ncbi:hypothetical protein [Vibrio crassostreae]|uniref:hypothetical protein n=1 Tax=Vibrio crassostreae TaxID=246167 RepID=UPI001B30FE26|nr:hypothetical protein [Vibrio crassostreae]
MTPFVCPDCNKESYHPMDAKYGWCEMCKSFTDNVSLIRATESAKVIVPIEINDLLKAVVSNEKPFCIIPVELSSTLFQDGQISLGIQKTTHNRLQGFIHLHKSANAVLLLDQLAENKELGLSISIKGVVDGKIIGDICFVA